MRCRLRVAVLASLGVASITPTPDAHACSCARTPGPCIALDEAPVVFVGVVTSLEKKADTLRAHFRVEERLRGIQSATVAVDTTTATSCGITFTNGARYLVYAWPLPSGAALATGACDRTRRLEDGRDDLDLLRAKSQGQPLTRVFGSLRAMPETASTDYPPVPGGTVVASGSARRFQTTTDATGRYRFDNLPAGSYTLKVAFPKGYRDLFAGMDDEPPIEIVPPVCGTGRDFWAVVVGKK